LDRKKIHSFEFRVNSVIRGGTFKKQNSCIIHRAEIENLNFHTAAVPSAKHNYCRAYFHTRSYCAHTPRCVKSDEDRQTSVICTRPRTRRRPGKMCVRFSGSSAPAIVRVDLLMTTQSKRNRIRYPVHLRQPSLHDDTTTSSISIFNCFEIRKAILNQTPLSTLLFCLRVRTKYDVYYSKCSVPAVLYIYLLGILNGRGNKNNI